MTMLSRGTPVPETAITVRNLCERCGGPAPMISLALGGVLQEAIPSEVRARYCDLCEPIVRREDDEREHAKHVENLLSHAGGDRKMRNWSFETYPDDPAAREAKATAAAWFEEFVIGEKTNLLLFGPVGTGKTGLAWSLVRAACEREIDATFRNFRDYLWDLRRSFNDPDWQADWRPHHIKLLALDDLGAERPTPFARDELATLVEHRVGQGLATVITSNYDPDELASRLGADERVIGDRILSRLVEDSLQFRFAGSDRRLA